MHYRPGNLLHALRGTPEKGENTCKAGLGLGKKCMQGWPRVSSLNPVEERKSKFSEHTSYILHTYCIHTAYILHTYCIHTAYILHTYCIHTAYILRTYCIHTAYILQHTEILTKIRNENILTKIRYEK